MFRADLFKSYSNYRTKEFRGGEHARDVFSPMNQYANMAAVRTIAEKKVEVIKRGIETAICRGRIKTAEESEEEEGTEEVITLQDYKKAMEEKDKLVTKWAEELVEKMGMCLCPFLMKKRRKKWLLCRASASR